MITMKSLIISLLVISTVTFSPAQKRAFTIADLYKVKSIADPQFSPDGKKIAFTVTESFLAEGKTNAEVYIADADGSNPKNVTNNPASDNHPRWSPDGKWIAFTSLAGNFQICIVRAQGGDAIVVGTGEDPSWAANSRALIFCHGPDHSKKLSLLDVPTKQVKDIARILESNSQSQPSWAKQ